MRRAITLSIAACAFVCPQVWGQRLVEEPVSVQHLLPSQRDAWLVGLVNPRDVRTSYPSNEPLSLAAFGDPSDHRWEGVAIGGGAFGLTAALLRASWCNQDNSAATENCVGTSVLWGLMGATVGTVVGGFIGSAIPK